MKQQLKKNLFIPLIACVVFLATTGFQKDYFEIAKQLEIFTSLFKEVNMNYVDETNPGDLMDHAIKSMLSSLDPYTNFMSEQDVEAARINNTGDYTGIGARVKTLKDKLLIMEPYKGYPADKAGLKAGDEIIQIGAIKTEGYNEATGNLLKGAANTTVEVTYKRQNKTYTTSITRAEVDIKAVPHYSMISNRTGYLVLSQFNAKAARETGDALRDLKAKGADRIILDLRGNPGGLLNQAIDIVNLFIPKGQLVVNTKSKVKKFNKTYYTKKEPVDDQIPLVVLINERSASASEIVSGSLQDLDRAVIVGTRSFGKGLVQRPKSLTYGTQVKMTISRYYTPSGRCIQALDYLHKNDKGEATRVKQEDYNVFRTKNGRKVFDAGGVLPDVVMSSFKNSPVISAMIDKNLVFNYATNYRHHNLNFDINGFTLNDSDFKNFKDYLLANNFSFETQTEIDLQKAYETAERDGLGKHLNSGFKALKANLIASKNFIIEENKDYLLKLITEEIVKQYAYREGLYDYYKLHDHTIKKAVDILENPTSYKAYLK